ncbi:hypothetical protein [Nocardia sp. NPDC004260]
MGDKFETLRVATIHTLAGIAKVLGMLPIPIEISADPNDESQIEDVLRARRLIREVPMGEVLRAAVNTAIIDWMSGLTLGMLADQGDDEDKEWLLTAALVAMTRCEHEIEFALDLISGRISEE